jgi:hypothetical protein
MLVVTNASLDLAIKQDATSRRLMANEVIDANKAGSLWLSPGLLEQFQQISQTENGEITLSEQAAAALGVNRIVLSPGLVLVLSMLAKNSIASQKSVSQSNGAFSDSAISRVVGRSLHKHGRAVDISRYAGFRINVFQEEEALKGVVSLIGALPSGYYLLGLPRLPADPFTNAEQARKDFEEKSRFNFYKEGNSQVGPLALPELRPEWKSHSNMFLDRTLPVDTWPPNSAPLEKKVYFELEHIYDAQARRQLIDAVQEAEARGVFIVHVFPNGVDHVDVSVGDSRESFNSERLPL